MNTDDLRRVLEAERLDDRHSFRDAVLDCELEHLDAARREVQPHVGGELAVLRAPLLPGVDACNGIDFAALDSLKPEPVHRVELPDVIRRDLHCHFYHHCGPPSRRFKTSRVVAARRALDVGLITRTTFFEFWEAYQAEEYSAAQATSDGGDFWNTQGVRIGRRFSYAVVNAVKEGRLLYQDAYELTGLKGGTFDTLVERVREDA